ncbi:hypothetical protein LOD99_12342 [Oopsacas minuta]|uniref:Phytanoyl-CoA dioxygenase n=1 Tax=Oopsacas minuta TaxID=111878 RepID=A0AAV7JFC1_9METZ|nr:hypothetical protein LOD99_12342 [Oopsacas minuta]
MEYESEKYLSTKETAHNTLKEFGVSIIPNILDEKEIVAMNNGIWSFLEEITSTFKSPIKKEDTSTWREFYNLFPIHSMLLQHFGIGHAQHIWDIRQNPKVAEVFAHLWKVPSEELLVSFDGSSFHLPPEETKRGWYKNNKWLHSDQSFTRNKLECIQGWVTGYNVNEHDASLTVLEGSHNLHKEFREHFKVTEKKDWFKINEEQTEFYIKKGCKQKIIKCPAGSLVLWDSRTIHSGIECNKKRKKSNFRNVVYVCMTPRRLADSVQLKKKRKAFTDLRTTSHWPHKISLFPKSPRTYGKALPTLKAISPPVVTKLGKKLAGF